MADTKKRGAHVDRTTPVMVGTFVALSEPIDYKNDGKMAYQIVGRCENEGDERALQTEMEGAVLERFGLKLEDLSHPLWKKRKPKEGDEFVGFKFKIKANGEAKDRKTGELRTWSNKPIILGPDNKPLELPSGLVIGSGTRLRVAYRPFQWSDNGVSLQPVAIQVINLVTFQSKGPKRDAEYYGAAFGDAPESSAPRSTDADGSRTADF